MRILLTFILALIWITAFSQRITVPVPSVSNSNVTIGLPVDSTNQVYTVTGGISEVMTGWQYDSTYIDGFAADSTTGVITYFGVSSLDSALCNVTWGGAYTHGTNNTTLVVDLERDRGTGFHPVQIGSFGFTITNAAEFGSGSSSVWAWLGGGDKLRLTVYSDKSGTLTALSYYISAYCIE